jgi:hypothetical protein
MNDEATVQATVNPSANSSFQMRARLVTTSQYARVVDWRLNLAR